MDNNANAVMVIGALACAVAYVYIGGWSNDLIPVAIFIVFLWGLATWQLRLDKVTNKMIREKNDAEVIALEEKAKYYGYRARLARAKADILDKDDESPGTKCQRQENEHLRLINEHLRMTLENFPLTKQVNEAKSQYEAKSEKERGK